MSAHDHRITRPEPVVFHDGCEECRHRVEDGELCVLELDHTNAMKLWSMTEAQYWDGWEEHAPQTSLDAIACRQMYLIYVFMERYLGMTRDEVAARFMRINDEQQAFLKSLNLKEQ